MKKRCVKCGIKSKILTRKYIRPRARGGKDNIYNIQTLCKKCNETISKINKNEKE